MQTTLPKSDKNKIDYAKAIKWNDLCLAHKNGIFR